MSNTPISVIVLEPVIDSTRDLIKTISGSSQVEILEVSSAEEAFQVVQQFPNCVFVVSLRGSLDGKAQVELLTKLKKNISAGELKVLVASSVKKHPEARAIADLGIADYVEEPIPIRSLVFKVNNLFKTIRAKEQQKAAVEEKLVFKAGEKKSEITADVLKGEVLPKYKPALQLGEDTFVFKNSLPRKMAGKYVLQAEGPAPETGKWELEPSGEKEPQWRWVPTEENSSAAKANSKDGWVHSGEEPIFNPKTEKWNLKSKSPALFYRKNGKKEAAKVETNEEGFVVIAEDSPVALEKLIENKQNAILIREKLEKLKAEGSPENKKEGNGFGEGKNAEGPDLISAKGEQGKPEDEEAKEFSSLQTAEQNDDARKLGDLKLEGKNQNQKQINKGGLPGSDEANFSPSPLDKKGNDAGESDAFGARREKSSGESSPERSAFSFREESLEGLKKEDLEGEANLRDRMRSEVNLRREKKEEDAREPIGKSLNQARADESSYGERKTLNKLEQRTGFRQSLRAEEEEKSKSPAHKKASLREGGRGIRVNAVADENEGAEASPESEILSGQEGSEASGRNKKEKSDVLSADSKDQEALKRSEKSRKNLSSLSRVDRGKSREINGDNLEDSTEEGFGDASLDENAPESDEVGAKERADSIAKKRNFRAIESVEEENPSDFFGSKKLDPASKKGSAKNRKKLEESLESAEQKSRRKKSSPDESEEALSNASELDQENDPGISAADEEAEENFGTVSTEDSERAGDGKRPSLERLGKKKSKVLSRAEKSEASELDSEEDEVESLTVQTEESALSRNEERVGKVVELVAPKKKRAPFGRASRFSEEQKSTGDLSLEEEAGEDLGEVSTEEEGKEALGSLESDAEVENDLGSVSVEEERGIFGSAKKEKNRKRGTLFSEEADSEAARTKKPGELESESKVQGLEARGGRDGSSEAGFKEGKSKDADSGFEEAAEPSSEEDGSVESSLEESESAGAESEGEKSTKAKSKKGKSLKSKFKEGNESNEADSEEGETSEASSDDDEFKEGGSSEASLKKDGSKAGEDQKNLRNDSDSLSAPEAGADSSDLDPSHLEPLTLAELMACSSLVNLSHSKLASGPAVCTTLKAIELAYPKYQIAIILGQHEVTAAYSAKGKIEGFNRSDDCLAIPLGQKASVGEFYINALDGRLDIPERDLGFLKWMANALGSLLAV